jgi:hypothetical protein
MERELVNTAYLQELIDVTADQKEFDLISQLFDRLVISRDEFVNAFEGRMKNDREQISFQLHKLKNQFANLGCEAASQKLEEMYQLARSNKFDEVQQRLGEFEELSSQTFQKLQARLNH